MAIKSLDPSLYLGSQYHESCVDMSRKYRKCLVNSPSIYENNDHNVILQVEGQDNQKEGLDRNHSVQYKEIQQRNVESNVASNAPINCSKVYNTTIRKRNIHELDVGPQYTASIERKRLDNEDSFLRNVDNRRNYQLSKESESHHNYLLHTLDQSEDDTDYDADYEKDEDRVSFQKRLIVPCNDAILQELAEIEEFERMQEMELEECLNGLNLG